MEEEPFAARAQKKQFETVDNNTRNANKTALRKRTSTVDDSVSKRGSPSNLHENTLTASIKHKYIMRSRHEKLTNEKRFFPVNQS